MKSTKQQRAILRAENRKWPKQLTLVSKSQWQPVDWDDSLRIAVYRSREFLVQVFLEEKHSGVARISVNRTDQTPDGKWMDGITWDDLQSIKNEIGYGDCLAIEIFPPIKDLVNVANMRHLFVVRWTIRDRFDAIIPWWKKSDKK